MALPWWRNSRATSQSRIAFFAASAISSTKSDLHIEIVSTLSASYRNRSKKREGTARMTGQRRTSSHIGRRARGRRAALPADTTNICPPTIFSLVGHAGPFHSRCPGGNGFCRDLLQECYELASGYTNCRQGHQRGRRIEIIQADQGRPITGVILIMYRSGILLRPGFAPSCSNVLQAQRNAHRLCVNLKCTAKFVELVDVGRAI